ncbi:transglycosylase SLT domain-containing protein [Aliiroseovarius subalbicans]|uniref:transglycosylase SLT domain-containing protein n=1 Tax=Aliiroseovarius subalbicans TaxID=2925840 RepID=UPI001F56B07B|nr:transglycosylase SLT domain-containing protein [Aliiroseovarius subalbicans]MCI2398611.1 lytic transglycosylase domain-containing protein [Aliiroseovarius subalbicans]
MRLNGILALGATLVLAGCVQMPWASDPGAGGAAVIATKNDPAVALTMRWDHLGGSGAWTQATMAALASHGAALPATMPADIDAWCPGYRTASLEGRQAFWAGLLSTLAKHESTWNPRAVGGGGKWFGLVQIAPATARGYGCAAGSGEALKSGPANLSCAVRILARTVPRDGVVSQGMRGVAADWGPFHSARKREDMRAWTRAQGYCQS